MTQEEKHILLKDLCARLPYEVKYCREYWDYERDQEMCAVGTLESIDKDGYINGTKVYKAWDIKPYLRPMSSMTEEEKKDFIQYSGYEIEESVNGRHYEYYLKDYGVGSVEQPPANEDSVDWLNANHFDYRGLIEKGLAIEAPEGMYNTKPE